MILDKMEGFKALEHYGIRVAHSGYVDSAESAIAFATRRTAQDERFVPILLRITTPNAGMSSEQTECPLENEASVRAAYARLARMVPADGRILAHNVVEGGTDVCVEGRVDEGSRKVLALRGRTHAAQHAVPLRDEDARTLAENFMGFGHKPAASARKMIEHFLLLVSEFFEESRVESFTLDPVRLHEGAYTVIDATIAAPGRLHLKERLEPHAHDRKGHFHPSGQQ